MLSLGSFLRFNINYKCPGIFKSCQQNISCYLDKTFIPARPCLLCRSCPVVCSGISKPTVALTTQDTCLLRGNTLDLKPFLCPQAEYLWCIGPVQPSLNCICPEPADTGYNGDIDVLLRNPWVRIKELLASQQGQQGSVWTPDNVFPSASSMSAAAAALFARCKKKRHFMWYHMPNLCARVKAICLTTCSAYLWKIAVVL